MKKFSTRLGSGLSFRLATLAFAAFGLAFPAFADAANWTFSDNVLSDGDWSFAATADGTALTVGEVQSAPASVTPLDFSKTVEGGYTIVALNPAFGQTNSQSDPAAGQYAGKVGVLTMPGSGLVSIGAYAFCGCTNATGTMNFPETLTSVGQCAFAFDSQLTFNAEPLPSGVKTIANRVFAQCHFPDSVTFSYLTSLGAGAFRNSYIRNITFGAALAEIGGSDRQGAFNECTNLVSVTFNANSKINLDADYLFYGCKNLTYLDLRAVTNIVSSSKTGPFYGCTSLRHLWLGTLPSLPNNFFMGAESPADGVPFVTDLHFTGKAPTFAEGWRLPDPPTSWERIVGYKSRMATFVHLDSKSATYETDLASWKALTADGNLATTGTAWSATYAGSAENAAKRPLLLWQSPTITIETTVDADEGKEGYGYFLLSRGDDDPLETTIPVNFTISGTATPGQTYCSIYPDTEIRAGEKSVKVKVRPLNDPKTTADTTVTLTLATDPNNYYTIGATASATLTVTNAAKYGGYLYADAGKWNLLAHMGNTGLGNVTANTPAAAKYCVDHGYAFEVDVQWDETTGVLYLDHDAKSGITSDWTNTFQNVLKVLPTGAVFKVDAKCSTSTGAVEAIIAAIKADKTNERAFLAINYDPGTMWQRIHQEFTNVDTWSYSGPGTTSDPAANAAARAEDDLNRWEYGHSYAWNEEEMTDEFFAEFNKRGITIDVWTIEDPRTIKELVNRGARYITTNNPFPVTAALPSAADPVIVEKEAEVPAACEWTTALWNTNSWTRPAAALAGGAGSADQDGVITTDTDVGTTTEIAWEFSQPMDLTSLTLYTLPGSGRQCLSFTNGVLVKYKGASEYVKLADSERRCYSKLWEPQSIVFAGTNDTAFVTNVVAIKLTPTETKNGFCEIAETVLLGTASSGGGEEEEEETSSSTWTTGSYSDEEYVETSNRLNGGSVALVDGDTTTRQEVYSNNSFTYEFDEAKNISEVRVYSSWGDTGRVGFKLANLQVKYDGADGFVELPGTGVDCGVSSAPTTNRLYAAITNQVEGFVATNVVAVKVVFAECQGGYIGVAEIEIAGETYVESFETGWTVCNFDPAKYKKPSTALTGTVSGGQANQFDGDITTKSKISNWGSYGLDFAQPMNISQIRIYPRGKDDASSTKPNVTKIRVKYYGDPSYTELSLGYSFASGDWTNCIQMVYVPTDASKFKGVTSIKVQFASANSGGDEDNAYVAEFEFCGEASSPSDYANVKGDAWLSTLDTTSFTMKVKPRWCGGDNASVDIYTAIVEKGGTMPTSTLFAEEVAAGTTVNKIFSGLTSGAEYDVLIRMKNDDETYIDCKSVIQTRPSGLAWSKCSGSYGDYGYDEVANRLKGGNKGSAFDGNPISTDTVYPCNGSESKGLYTLTFESAQDLTDVRIYSAWSDTGRVGFSLSNLWIKVEGSDEFVEIPNTSVDHGITVPPTANRLFAGLANSDGSFIATQVTAMKIYFSACQSGHIGVAEVEVAGTASITETLTANYEVTSGQLAATATSAAASYPIDVYFCSGNTNGGNTTNGWDNVTKVQTLTSSSDAASWNGAVAFRYARFTFESSAYAGTWVWSEVGDVAQDPAATTEVGATTHTNAALTATITAFGIPASAADIYLAYGTTENPTDYKLVTKGAVTGANALEMTNLTENTTYYYSVMISNSCDKTSTTGGSFTTPWSPEEQQRPTGTVTVDDIRSSRATANIALTSPGTGADAADIWFASVIHGGEMPALTRIATGAVATDVATKTITGLSGSTVYDYRVVLSNALDRTRELTGSFTTAQAPFDDTDTPTTREIPYRALPPGYTQVEWLMSPETSGSWWIDTDVQSTATMLMDMDFQLYDAFPGDFCGQNVQDNSTDWRPYITSGRTIFDIGAYRIDRGATFALDTRYRLQMGYTGDSLVVDVASGGVSSFSASTTLATAGSAILDEDFYIFACKEKAGVSAAKMKLWSCVLKENCVLTRDFVPAVRTLDNKPGLYDVVSGGFFTDGGVGTYGEFRPGNAVLGVGVTATAAYSFTTKEWTMTFDITSGSGALYAVVQDASGNRKLELVKADAAAGDHIVYILESVVGDEYQIGYKTVAGDYKDYSFIKTTHQKPVGTIASQNITMTNAEVVVTLTTAGELEPTSDLYFAFAKKGEAIPALTKVATGMSDGQVFTNLCADLDHSTEYDCIAIFSNSVYGTTLEHSFSTRTPCNWTTGTFDPEDFELPEHWLSGGVTANYRDSKVNDKNGYTTLTATSTNAWDFAEAQDIYTIDFYLNSAADRQAGIAFGNILVKYEGADDFVEIPNTSLDYVTGGSKATLKASLASLTGVIATNVVAVRVPTTQVNGDNTRLHESVMTGEASHRVFVAWTFGECATNEFVREADAILPGNALLKSYSNIGGVVADGDLNTKSAELSEGHTYEWQFSEAVNVRELDLYSNGGLYNGNPDVNRAIFQVASVSAMFKGSSEWTQLGGGSFDKYSFGGQVKVSKMVSCSGAAYALRNVTGVRVVLGKPSLDNAKPYIAEVQLCGASAFKPGFIIIVR